ncbi:hypothetical protein TUN205_07684 [Pyrenophora tritici-repentis]|nr:hypothetical protein TUN205_07684 [Pyrenophora tritici-repentis]
MRSCALIINTLWRFEGVFIVESMADQNDCSLDNRGPPENKVCLEERPDHSYWIQAITHYDDEKIREPPSMQLLKGKEEFHGIHLSDVVRSSFWWEEIVDPRQGDPEKRSSDGNPKTDIQLLTDYGNVPGEFHLPICRSWFGEAITAIDTKKGINAPRQCDAPNKADAAKWGSSNQWTMFYTQKAIRVGNWYNFGNYGKMCRGEHKCSKGGSWETILELQADDKPVKGMEEAWSIGCVPNAHGSYELRPRQLTDPELTETSLKLQDTVSSTPETTRAPIVQIKTQETTNSTCWSTNASTGIEHQGPCNGPECIIDTIYALVERKFGYHVNSSEALNGFPCLSGDDWCVEDTAHNLCEDLSDEEDAAGELGTGWE